MVTAAVVAQLEAVDLHEWAVYAALHLPDDLQRGRAVHELLTRHAPQWAADAGAREFLVSRLRIPAARLSDALALWAQVRLRSSACRCFPNRVFAPASSL